MIVTAWILLATFGFLSFITILGILGSNRVSVVHIVWTSFNIIVTALSAGVIWGGLFQ